MFGRLGHHGIPVVSRANWRCNCISRHEVTFGRELQFKLILWDALSRGSFWIRVWFIFVHKVLDGIRALRILIELWEVQLRQRLFVIIRGTVWFKQHHRLTLSRPMWGLLLLQLATLFLGGLSNIEISKGQLVSDLTHIGELKFIRGIFLLLFIVTPLQELELFPFELVEILGLSLFLFCLALIHHAGLIVDATEILPLFRGLVRVVVAILPLWRLIVINSRRLVSMPTRGFTMMTLRLPR